MDRSVGDSAQHLAGLSITLLVLLPAVYTLSYAVYNLFFHPLRSYAGPWLWSMSRLPADYYTYRGSVNYKIAEMHQKYGPVVRYMPDAVSYCSAPGYYDIYAHKPGKQEWPKDPKNAAVPPNKIPSILYADKDNHSRYRRILAHAFSEKGLQEQQPRLLAYVDLLIDRLREVATKGEVTDLVEWIHIAVFDTIGDLAFGTSFNGLKERKVHDWLPAVLGSVTYLIKTQIFRAWNLEEVAGSYIVPKDLKQSRMKNYGYMKEKLDERAQLGSARGMTKST
jgi:hypothetical protein